MSDSRHERAFIVGVVVGATCGAAAMLWVTPVSGEEVRQHLRQWGQALQRQTLTTIGDLQSRGQDVLARGVGVLPVFADQQGLEHVLVSDDAPRLAEPLQAGKSGIAEDDLPAPAPLNESTLESHHASADT